MLYAEILASEDANRDKIILYKEGMFLKAYEHSAYFFHRYVSAFKFRAGAYGPSGSPSTKTVYGSIDNTSQTYQMFKWVEGDKVRIYSPQAGLQEDAENHFDGCVVDGVTADGNTSVATVSSTHGNGLVWGEEDPHYFYAVYPSTSSNPESTIAACRKYRIYGLTFPYINGIVCEGEGISWNGNIDVTSGGETITWD